MKKIELLRKLRFDMELAYERLGAARRDHTLTEYIRGEKVDMIKKEIEIIREQIKKLGL